MHANKKHSKAHSPGSPSLSHPPFLFPLSHPPRTRNLSRKSVHNPLHQKEDKHQSHIPQEPKSTRSSSGSLSNLRVISKAYRYGWALASAR